MIQLDYSNEPTALHGVDQIVVIGTKAALARPEVLAELPAGLAPTWGSMLEALSPGDNLAATSTWIARGEGDAEGKAATRVSVVAVSERVSRHNAPGRPDVVANALKGRFTKGRGAVLVALERAEELAAVGVAVARAFPLYSKKKRSDGEVSVVVSFLAEGGARPHDSEIARVRAIARAVREAARLTDMPAAELSTEAFVAEARALAGELGLEVTVLDKEALAERGLGGLVAVGQAARRGPALVHLRWPGRGGEGADKVAWVGKGIVYDTGGLSLKGKLDMPGMKVDMGGAAAVLEALRVAAELGAEARIDAILCLAENSVGPDALRPDDVITLYSGKTVEVNNTDAEGRLVLADGVAYAVKDCGANVVVDLATLTGAQLMATGKLHAAIVSNDEGLEARALAAGRRSGDLVFALPYAPELFRGEFHSQVADLRNSVKDRMNAQSSCAAQFVAESLPPADAVRWLHVDMAGPVTVRDRATGFGVALLAELFLRQPST